MLMATFTGASVAMRDEYHEARKRARVEREEWAHRQRLMMAGCRFARRLRLDP